MSVEIKTVALEYDVWAKLTNIKTILAEKEKNITHSEIINRSLHLLIKDLKIED